MMVREKRCQNLGGENKDIGDGAVLVLVQQGHYWSYLRAEPFCAGFGGFSVWGKLLGYPISCHVIFPLQRYVISGRLYLEGNFVRVQYFTLDDIYGGEEARLVFGGVD